MSFHRKLQMFIMLVTGIPYWVQAQGKFEINFGISTPGMIELQDTKLFNIGLESFDGYYYKYYNKQLSDLDKEVYTHTANPCYSVEMAYKLAESGFFKRLDLVGFFSFHSALYEKLDIVNRTTSEKETARKLGILIGIRYNILKKNRFNMYTQFLSGGDIRDKSRFWDDMSDKWSDNDGPAMQFTFLGFNWSGNSGLGSLIELGFGSEYAGGILFPIFPGVRAGLSYKF